MIDLLIKLLPLVAPALRYHDNPNRPLWRLDLLTFTLLVYALDVILAQLFLAPKKGEWTVSHVLERTSPYKHQHWMLAKSINRISPGHIKAAI